MIILTLIQTPACILSSVKCQYLHFFSPVAAPTSFEGPFGKISYRVKAVIDTPRFSKDYKAQRPFYLLNLLNLNEVPDIEVRNRRALRTSLTAMPQISNRDQCNILRNLVMIR